MYALKLSDMTSNFAPFETLGLLNNLYSTVPTNA